MLRCGLTIALCLFAAGCGEPEIIVPDVLTVFVEPPHGSVGISPRVQGLVYFSHPAKDADAVAHAVRLECRGTPPCDTPVESGCPSTPASYTVAYDATAQVARVTLAEDLAADTCYVYIVEAGIEAADAHIGKLPVEVRASFQTR